jgi:hypothetical protein
MALRAEVVGFRLVGSAGAWAPVTGPISNLEVVHRPGLAAFAGLNGAGKSRVLDGIEAALRGDGASQVSWQVVFRLVDGDEGESSLAGLVTEGLGFGAREVTSEWRGRVAARIIDLLGDVDLEDVYPDSTALGLAAQAFSDLGNLAEAIADQGAFVLSAEPAAGLLTVSIGADRRTEHARLRALFDASDSEWQRAVAAGHVDGDGENFYEPLGVAGPQMPVSYEDGLNPTFGTLLPVPLLDIWQDSATYGSGSPFNLVTVNDSADVVARTRALLSGLMASAEDAFELLTDQDVGTDRPVDIPEDVPDFFFQRTGEDGVFRPKSLTDAASVLGLVAMTWFLDLTGDPLNMRCRVHPLHTWLGEGDAFTWEAFDNSR